jgi:hypothetical protein
MIFNCSLFDGNLCSELGGSGHTVYAYVEYYVTAGRVANGYDAFFPE